MGGWHCSLADRPVKVILMKQLEVELESSGGTTVAVRVLTCAWAFFGEAAAEEVFAVTKGKWKEKVNKRFDELAQEEYETKLRETETGRRYLQSKPEWGMAHWLERSRGLRLWGKRAALYRLFQFRCNGHHLKSETSRHKVKIDGEWRVANGSNACVMCCKTVHSHKECPARMLFECHKTTKLRETFYDELGKEAGPEVAAELRAKAATGQWETVNGWLDGRGWTGREEAFDLVLGHLVTLVHEVLQLRLSFLK